MPKYNSRPAQDGKRIGSHAACARVYVPGMGLPRDYQLAATLQPDEHILIADGLVVRFMREFVAFFFGNSGFVVGDDLGMRQSGDARS